MLQLLLNSAELALLDMFETVGYGEIYEVCAYNYPGDVARQVGENTANFFARLKEIGHFDRVIVHDSEPAYAEYRDVISQHECLIKVKF